MSKNEIIRKAFAHWFRECQREHWNAVPVQPANSSGLDERGNVRLENSNGVLAVYRPKVDKLGRVRFTLVDDAEFDYENGCYVAA